MPPEYLGSSVFDIQAMQDFKQHQHLHQGKTGKGRLSFLRLVLAVLSGPKFSELRFLWECRIKECKFDTRLSAKRPITAMLVFMMARGI